MNLKDRFSGKQDDQKNTSADQSVEQNSCVELYDSPGNSRNICFIQANGVITFLNYAYLVSGKINDRSDSIDLVFTTHAVKVSGKNLLQIFFLLMKNEVRALLEKDARYLPLAEKDEGQITEILITPC